MLPYCGWGCNIFSCVDCTSSDYTVYEFEEGSVRPQDFSLEAFFEMWLRGVDILSVDGREDIVIDIVNPFTGEKDSIVKRRKK